MKIIILDLDNCISNDKWRWPLIDRKTADPALRYHMYHLRAIYDEIGNAHLLKTPHRIVICTGRPETYRVVTMKWLAKQEIEPQAILMREEKDHRPAAVSKVDLIQSYLLQTDHTVVHAYDDRPDVIDAYNRMGLFPSTEIFIHAKEVPIGH
jgi:hypothetical protein